MRKLVAAVLALAALATLSACRTHEGGALVVRGAASLTDVLPRLADAWATSGHVLPTLAVDASSRVAQQIVAGAPTDVFIAADEDWMDDLERRGLLVEGTRRDVLANELVLVVPASAAAPPRSVDALAATLGDGRIAIAGENVPAGRYARAAITASGLWPRLSARALSGDTVRTTLAWVARGEADAGIVYATDARSEPRVSVAFTFAASSHPPIRYPAAVIRGGAREAEARAFLDFLRSSPARALVEQAGFSVPSAPPSATPSTTPSATPSATPSTTPRPTVTPAVP